MLCNLIQTKNLWNLVFDEIPERNSVDVLTKRHLFGGRETGCDSLHRRFKEATLRSEISVETTKFFDVFFHKQSLSQYFKTTKIMKNKLLRSRESPFENHWPLVFYAFPSWMLSILFLFHLWFKFWEKVCRVTHFSSDQLTSLVDFETKTELIIDVSSFHVFPPLKRSKIDENRLGQRSTLTQRGAIIVNYLFFSFFSRVIALYLNWIATKSFSSELHLFRVFLLQVFLYFFVEKKTKTKLFAN